MADWKKKLVSWLSEKWDDAVVYLVTFVAVLASQYQTAFMSNEDFVVSMGTGRILFGLGISFYLVVKSEAAGQTVREFIGAPPRGLNAEEKTRWKEGKRKNFNRRLELAFLHGYSWNQGITLAATALGQ